MKKEDRRKNNGGHSTKGFAGPKPLPEGVEKKEQFSVSLYPTYAEKVKKKFGSLTKAMESLKPDIE